MERKYEIRCPIHGFIELNGWERDIINQPAFQRLRRIRQLGLTDYVYPGAMHTRFEHSLGVMHVATRMYDSIVARSAEVLKAELGYNDDGLRRDRMIVRLAALLHDVGHAPLSHAAEEIMPTKPDGTRYKHEDYTAAIIRQELREVIDSHPYNRTNYGITAETTAQLIEGQRCCHRDSCSGNRLLPVSWTLIGWTTCCAMRTIRGCATAFTTWNASCTVCAHSP
jgi:HD superfamily phosphohydrolase